MYYHTGSQHLELTQIQCEDVAQFLVKQILFNDIQRSVR